SLDMLILARIIQGAGAALLVPTSLALLSQLFPEAQSRARAIGIWGSVAGIGAASGPVIGGLLVNTLSWRSIFLINAPVGLLGFWFTLRLISPSQPQQTRGFDSAAQVIAILGLAALTFALIEGATLGWPIILMLIATFILAAVIFILIERRVQQPMLPLTLFSSATFSAGNIVGLLLNMGFYGQLFVINLFFQQILNYPSLQTGLALLPETGTVLLSSMLSGRITGQVGPRLPMIIGPAVGCAGFCAMALVGTTTPYILTIVMLAAMGFGLAFAMPAMTAAVISAAPPERSGIASGALNANRQVGGVLGVALLGSLVGQHTSFVSGMHGAMLIAAATFFISFLLSLLLVKNPSARRA
ncbi:MAG: MFS transporter, partial [Ktedonobacteraceae bacterium]|nr:MFS transporter [Ktedonobacteraceae bacterium]